MGLACDVYTRLMFQRGHGYPLWEPEPTECGEVLIGDVGYVLDGGFYRLFNAMLAPEDPLNQPHGVPEGFKPFLCPRVLRHHHPHALDPGPICSNHVTAATVDGSFDVGVGGGPGAAARLRFKCTNDQGAVLVLKHEARREALHPSQDLTRYILNNHDSWSAFARDVLRLDIQPEDIIFVSGSMKTAEWALAAATHNARSGEIQFGGELWNVAKATFSYTAGRSTSMSAEHRCGPKVTTNPRDPSSLEDGGASHAAPRFDQCVFLHYYKVKRRILLGPKVIRGAAEGSGSPSRRRSPSPSPDDPCGVAQIGANEAEEYQVDRVPGYHKYDPLDAVLDFILDRSGATCAIASDGDLEGIIIIHGGNIPDDIYASLVDAKYPIFVDDAGAGTLKSVATIFASHSLKDTPSMHEPVRPTDPLTQLSIVTQALIRDISSSEDDRAISYTDDAHVEVGPRVLRMCHNCNTTSTHIWRRSSLNPGKVLCNQCAVSERLHYGARRGRKSEGSGVNSSAST